ncbi:unnamed protein product [Caenorhabditis angaria]|uniref:Histone deacetylase domain-containing protein n=1 Tax=Caenorhabditis angaria TaxID=860376 RepID=A0A9P1N361_9PELO|nr:unnamed protein product [Caenorhabditis angaria]
MLLLDDKTEVRNTSRTLVGFNELENHHKNVICPDHPESSLRITRIRELLEKTGVLDQCDVLTDFLEVDEQDLELTHNKEMIEKIGNSENMEQDEINTLCTYFDSVFMTNKSNDASKQAIGCVRDLTHQIINNKAANGFAIIRPPGHHADRKDPCGFCIYNNVAQAAEEAFLNGADRILIVDLDVHHGNGTQNIFYDDKRVLYFSIHRYEYGKYWPHLKEGNFDHVGEGSGVGYNANIPLNETGCGDSDYLSILFNVLLPLAAQFDPHFVIFSVGFDSCLGDPLGSMLLSPTCYSHIIYHLKSLAKGRLLLVLEGGYNHQVCAVGVEKCLRILLGYPPEKIENLEPVKDSTVVSCLGLISILRNYWTCFALYPSKSSMRLSEWPLIEISAEFKYNPEEKPADTANIDQENLLKIEENSVMDYQVSKNETMIYYNEGDIRHRDITDSEHPEKPERTAKIMEKLRDFTLKKSERIAEDDEILLVHTEQMLNELKTTQTMTQDELDNKMDELDSIFLTNDTLNVAKTSVGTLLQVGKTLYFSSTKTWNPLTHSVIESE